SRRFAVGFTAGGFTALLIGACFVLAPGGLLNDLFDRYVNLALWLLPAPLSDPSFAAIATAEDELEFRPGLWHLVYVEAVAALPVLALALAGGLLAPRLAPVRTPNRPRPDSP